MKIKMKMKEFRIWDCGFRKPSLRSQRLSGKSLRVSEYPTSPEAVVRMGGGGSEGAKNLCRPYRASRSFHWFPGLRPWLRYFAPLGRDECGG